MTPRAARGWLALYGLALFALGFVQHSGLLAAALLLAFIAAGHDRLALLGRACRAALPFVLAVAAGQLMVSAWRGEWPLAAMARLNLRVLLMVFLGFWFIARVDLLRALSFSPTLTFVATLACGQARTFARIAQDFRLAFASRRVGTVHWRDRTRHAAAQATHLLDKAVANAAESAQALRARGCFDD